MALVGMLRVERDGGQAGAHASGDKRPKPPIPSPDEDKLGGKDSTKDNPKER